MDVALRGRVDSLTAPDFLAAYEKAAGAMALTDVRLDVVVLMMIKAVQPGHVAVSGANETVREILTQTGCTDMLTME